MSVFFAAVLPVIILFFGLALDVGMLELKKLQVQGAADAAALGAELTYAQGVSNWAVEGQDDAAVNGFTDGVGGVTVVVVQTATYGEYAGYPGTIQATMTSPVKTLFMGALGIGKTVSAYAVSLVPNCSFFTNASLRSQNFSITSSTVSANCSLYMNQGMAVGSTGTASGVGWNVVGPSSASGNTGVVSPMPTYNTATAPDPLAGVTQPAFSSCTYTNQNISNTTITAYPGTYCNSFTASNSTITLMPGLYIIVGGGSLSQDTFTGAGVTLFFTHGGGFGYGQFSVTGSTMNLSAPTSNSSGGIPGILIFGDRNWTLTDTTNGFDFKCSGTSYTGNGIWYTTTTGVSFSTCPLSAPNYFGMVTDHFSNSGSSWTFRSDYSMVSGGNPMFSSGGLVE
jgi:hypothetical protein